MRKAIGLSFVCCLLVVGLACSGDSSTPTAPATTGSDLTSVTGAVKPAKDLICHYNSADDPYGVITEVTAKTSRRHAFHENDCDLDDSCGWVAGDPCDPSDCSQICS